ncbi:hypothetical protein HYW84_02770 [Candidatus Peregrinibacteria bacterium]|nr:hypothetical protein [Candidatus Peregrinibacteria bacterium]
MSVLEKLAADPNQDSETVCTLVETLRGYMGMWEHTHPQVGEYHPHLDAIVRDAQRTRLNRVLGKELFGMESPSVGAL